MKKLALALILTTAISSAALADSPAVRQMKDFDYVSQVSQPVETRTSGEYMPKSEDTYKEHGHKHGHHMKHGHMKHHHMMKDHKDKMAAHPHHHHHHHHKKTDMKKDVKTDTKQ